MVATLVPSDESLSGWERALTPRTWSMGRPWATTSDNRQRCLLRLCVNTQKGVLAGIFRVNPRMQPRARATASPRVLASMIRRMRHVSAHRVLGQGQLLAMRRLVIPRARSLRICNCLDVGSRIS